MAADAAETVLGVGGGGYLTAVYVMFHVSSGGANAPNGTTIAVHTTITVNRDDGPPVITSSDTTPSVTLGNGWGWFQRSASSGDPHVQSIVHDMNVGGFGISLAWHPGPVFNPGYAPPGAPSLSGVPGDRQVTLTLVPIAPQHQGFAGGIAPTYQLFRDGVQVATFSPSKGPGVPITVTFGNLTNGRAYAFKVQETYVNGAVPTPFSGVTMSNEITLTPTLRREYIGALLAR